VQILKIVTVCVGQHIQLCSLDLQSQEEARQLAGHIKYHNIIMAVIHVQDNTV